MKAALIPPTSALKRFGNGEFHLLLSHLLADSRYMNHYIRARKNGAYLCLDNSAHENGSGNDPEQLMFQACSLNAQEIVVPDVLDDADRTIEGALSAHEAWYEKRISTSDVVRSKAMMYVPQGANYSDWQFCLSNLVRIHLFTSRRYNLHRNFVIGLSKDYERWDGGLMKLIDEDLLPLWGDLHQQGIRMHVHLLGWGRKLWDLEAIARKHKWIRSTDSAKPFVYALGGIALDPTVPPPEYPTRPQNYFNRRMDKHQETQAALNSLLFRAVATGNRHNTVSV